MLNGFYFFIAKFALQSDNTYFCDLLQVIIFLPFSCGYLIFRSECIFNFYNFRMLYCCYCNCIYEDTYSQYLFYLFPTLHSQVNLSPHFRNQRIIFVKTIFFYYFEKKDGWQKSDQEQQSKRSSRILNFY